MQTRSGLSWGVSRQPVREVDGAGSQVMAPWSSCSRRACIYMASGRAPRVKRIVVVGTQHEEKGLTNVASLLSLLEQLRPEVIYMESPPEAFEDYFNNTRKSLEAAAATRYRADCRVELVPVDLPTPAAKFFQDSQTLFEAVERSSRTYCRLVDQHRCRVGAYGFAYLNSAYCKEYFSQLHEAVREAVARIGDHKLIATYDSWTRTHRLRDEGMMANIEKHARQVSFSTAVFLVGVAHRHSMNSVRPSQQEAEAIPLNWEFIELLENPNRSEHDASAC